MHSKLTGVSEPASAQPESHSVWRLTGQWHDRQYLLHVPRHDPPATEPRALVVQLHGRGIDAAMFDRWTGF